MSVNFIYPALGNVKTILLLGNVKTILLLGNVKTILLLGNVMEIAPILLQEMCKFHVHQKYGNAVQLLGISEYLKCNFSSTFVKRTRKQGRYLGFLYSSQQIAHAR